MPDLLTEYPALRVRWEGQQEQNNESMGSLRIGFIIAMIAMYVLLTIEFHSYLQPLIVMSVIPFGAIGAIWGHWLLGIDLTLFSMFGLVALTGVVVNDSIVLIDFINMKLDDGMPLREALIESGRQRFRAVMLTSLTTIAGLGTDADGDIVSGPSADPHGRRAGLWPGDHHGAGVDSNAVQLPDLRLVDSQRLLAHFAGVSRGTRHRSSARGSNHCQARPGGNRLIVA